MDQVASFNFRDLEANCGGYAKVSASSGVVALVVSLESNGDIEIFVTPVEAMRLAAALANAATRAEGGEQ